MGLLLAASFVLLVALNAFFVYAEFASVRIRGSQIEEMLEKGLRNAALLQRIHAKLDEYLSVCQVGITFASVALGFVGEVVAAGIVRPFFAHGAADGGSLAVHVVATAISVIFVSFVHILLGEQVPKLAAIRDEQRSALATARALTFFHGLFWAPLWVLNASAHAILRLIGLGDLREREDISEGELRILLERGQGSGLMSFRRLLFMENIFDLGEMRARDAMRAKEEAVSLSPSMPADDIIALVRRRRFSRFLVVGDAVELPLGYVHVKDLRAEEGAEDVPSLDRITRQPIFVEEDILLEQLLAMMQSRRVQMAVMVREGRWTGFLTIEDILEEIVGTIGDEFEEDPPMTLAETLSPGRVVTGIEGHSIVGAVRIALSRVMPGELPAPSEEILRAVAERERLAATYMGKGIAIPHAKLGSVSLPSLLVIRSETGVPVENSTERARLLFVLITPAAQPRVHLKLLSRVAELLEGSEYVVDRLLEAKSSGAMFEIIVTAEQASID
jgi:CBS domain containing-hemolysin-like protein/mannitol/fructose-specific phosphotransferase system IIA component (Ntr-type)